MLSKDFILRDESLRQLWCVAPFASIPCPQQEGLGQIFTPQEDQSPSCNHVRCPHEIHSLLG